MVEFDVFQIVDRAKPTVESNLTKLHLVGHADINHCSPQLIFSHFTTTFFRPGFEVTIANWLANEDLQRAANILFFRGNEAEYQDVQGWLDALQGGNNPFTEAVLKRLH
jgi:hypothetical protein